MLIYMILYLFYQRRRNVVLRAPVCVFQYLRVTLNHPDIEYFFPAGLLFAFCALIEQGPSTLSRTHVPPTFPILLLSHPAADPALPQPPDADCIMGISGLADDGGGGAFFRDLLPPAHA